MGRPIEPFRQNVRKRRAILLALYIRGEKRRRHSALLCSGIALYAATYRVLEEVANDSVNRAAGATCSGALVRVYYFIRKKGRTESHELSCRRSCVVSHNDHPLRRLMERGLPKGKEKEAPFWYRCVLLLRRKKNRQVYITVYTAEMKLCCLLK